MHCLHKELLEMSLMLCPFIPLNNPYEAALMNDAHAMTEFFGFRNNVRRKENGFTFLIQVLYQLTHVFEAERV